MNKILYVMISLSAEILLLFIGAFFASSETAFTSLSRITARQMLNSGEKNAKKVYSLRNNLDRLISTVLIGTNIVTTLLSSLTTAFTIKLFGASCVSYGTAVISMLVIIFSEIIPKTVAAIHPAKLARTNAPVISVIQKILFPIIWIFDQLSHFLDFFDSIIIRKKQPLVTEDELKTLLTLGKNEGTLEPDEKEMLDRIFEFSDLEAKDIMRHRSLVQYIDISFDQVQVVDAFAQSGYSRLPVIDGDPEKVLGVLHYKSVLFASPQIKSSRDFVRICMNRVLFVPESISTVDLLRMFKKEKENFSIVVNEYGETAGIVTMDDILRAVFGRITDEYGESEIAPEKRITVLGTREFLVPGDMKIEDVNDVLKLQLDSEVYTTLGGWLLEKFDELPPIGAVYKNAGAVFVVEDQAARRIQSVRIKL
ncbi:MAG: HlyC/CorC family transporter [Treponema sp.]|nr:HlyC/CorC family transporter [Treponema sp.]